MPKKRYLEYAGRTDEPDIYSGNLISSKSTVGDKVASQFNATMQNITRKAVSANRTRDAKLKRERDNYFSKVNAIKPEKEVAPNDNVWVNNGKLKNPELQERSIKGGNANAAWVADNPIKSTIGQIAGIAPLGIMSYPVLAEAGVAAAPIVNSAVGGTVLTSLLSGKPAWDMVSGNADWTTPIDLIPLYGPASKSIGAVGRGLYNYGKRGYRTLAKRYNRLTGEMPDKWDYAIQYRDEMLNYIKNEAKEASSYTVKPTLEDKKSFNKMYKRFLHGNSYSDPTIHNSLRGFKEIIDEEDSYYLPLLKQFGLKSKEEAIRAYNIFKYNPEYYIHMRDNGIKYPFSQKTVDDFIRRQLTSVRGVTAPDKRTAIEYLTSTQKGRRLSGGDRLGSNGGLYVSNNPTIGDRFKNPDGASKTGTGYVAILQEPDVIDRTLPIEQQLRQLRGRTEIVGTEEPMRGLIDPKALLDDNVRVIEDKYVGRANQGTGGYERAYLPNPKKGVVEHPVKVKRLTEYLNQTDKHGRWGFDIDATTDKNLFIAKRINAYDDYVKRARVFLKGKPVIDNNKYNDLVKNGLTHIKNRVDTRNNLLNRLSRSRRKYNKIKHNSIKLGSIGLAGGVVPYTLYSIGSVVERERMLSHYMDKGIVELTNNSKNPYVISDKRYENNKRLKEVVNHYNNQYNRNR